MNKVRHSTVHLLATAVLEIFPNAKFGIGPAIEDGFYYDFDLGRRSLTPSDLLTIKEKIKELIKKNLKFEKKELTIKEALNLFKNQPYKIELIKDLKKEGAKNVNTYKVGNFIDLCRGPHVKSTKEIPFDAFQLTRIAGAYWKGNEKNKMLQRIYGVSFSTSQELKTYSQHQEEAGRRNHRKLGKELELFAIIDEIGQGLPIWLPNGYKIRKVLEDYLYNLDVEYGYEYIYTPHIHRKKMFEISGHLQFYKNSMYAPMKIDDKEYYLKPMNCPASMMVYKMKPRSYRELPIKLGEFGTVYRYEQSGELHGLQRVRGFTQNDAHIFCRPDQLEEQFLEVFEMLIKFYKAVGFKNYTFRLSLSDSNKKKYQQCGTPEGWKQTEDFLRKFVKKTGIKYKELIGDATFYGPKLDVQAVNVFGKEDSISTIQIDFNLPERFDISYIDQDQKKQRPFVIHRAFVGSFERFFAFLIEFFGGAFPLWLSPVQVKILPISEKHLEYSRKVTDSLKQAGIRVKSNEDNDTIGKKIRESEIKKIPYLLIIGDKESKAGTVAVRARKQGDLGATKLEEFIKRIKNEIEEKK